MRVTLCQGTGMVQTTIMRGLGDSDERRLVISAPWQQPIERTVATIWNQLTAEEQREVVAAFGIGQPPEAS